MALSLVVERSLGKNIMKCNEIIVALEEYMNKQKSLDWLMPATGITFLLSLFFLIWFAASSQYTKYISEWEEAPAQQTLEIDALYFPDDGITACAADLCENSRTITMGDSNTLHLTKKPLKNGVNWFFSRLSGENQVYYIEIELDMGKTAAVVALKLRN